MTFVFAAFLFGWLWPFVGAASALMARLTTEELPVWVWLLLIAAGPFSLLVALISGVRHQHLLPQTVVKFLLKRV